MLYQISILRQLGTREKVSSVMTSVIFRSERQSSRKMFLTRMTIQNYPLSSLLFWTQHQLTLNHSSSSIILTSVQPSLEKPRHHWWDSEHSFLSAWRPLAWRRLVIHLCVSNELHLTIKCTGNGTFHFTTRSMALTNSPFAELAGWCSAGNPINHWAPTPRSINAQALKKQRKEKEGKRSVSLPSSLRRALLGSLITRSKGPPPYHPARLYSGMILFVFQRGETCTSRGLVSERSRSSLYAPSATQTNS